MKKYHNCDKNKPYVLAWTTTDYVYSREPEPDDKWDRGDETGTLEGYGVSIGQPNNSNRFYEDERAFNEEDIGFLPKRHDKVYLVIECYDSGDTFGHTSNRHRPMHIFNSYKNASKWVNSDEAARCQNSDYFGGHNNWLIKEVIVG